MAPIYNPTIQTFMESPTPEAEKATQMVNRYLYWITNQSNHQRLIDAFGESTGNHLWDKLVSGRNRCNDSFAGDMWFWFELSEGNRTKLMHYILRTEYKKQ